MNIQNSELRSTAYLLDRNGFGRGRHDAPSTGRGDRTRARQYNSTPPTIGRRRRRASSPSRLRMASRLVTRRVQVALLPELRAESSGRAVRPEISEIAGGTETRNTAFVKSSDGSGRNRDRGLRRSP